MALSGFLLVMFGVLGFIFWSAIRIKPLPPAVHPLTADELVTVLEHITSITNAVALDYMTPLNGINEIETLAHRSIGGAKPRTVLILTND